MSVSKIYGEIRQHFFQQTAMTHGYLSFLSICFALTFFMFVGCSPSGRLAGLVPCEGTVTYKGEPLAEALVTFVPMGEGRTANARTDATGKFVTETLNPKDGIYPGDYRVSVSKNEFYGEAPPPRMGAEGMEYFPQPQRSVIPTKYEEHNTSGLTLTVPAKGMKDALFELTE